MPHIRWFCSILGLGILLLTWRTTDASTCQGNHTHLQIVGFAKAGARALVQKTTNSTQSGTAKRDVIELQEYDLKNNKWGKSHAIVSKHLQQQIKGLGFLPHREDKASLISDQSQGYYIVAGAHAVVLTTGCWKVKKRPAFMRCALILTDRRRSMKQVKKRLFVIPKHKMPQFGLWQATLNPTRSHVLLFYGDRCRPSLLSMRMRRLQRIVRRMTAHRPKPGRCPRNCATWMLDQCNWCRCIQGRQVYCTRRSCRGGARQKPRCTKFY